MKIIWLAIAGLLFSTFVYAAEPGNPSFEDDDIDIFPWTVLDDGDFSGQGFVDDTGGATDGSNFGRLSFEGWQALQGSSCGWSSTGPAFLSSIFSAGAGEVISVDWRVIGTGDQAEATGYLINAGDDTVADTFFDQGAINSTFWDTASVVAPAADNYYLEFRVASKDSTGGCFVGAILDVDNVISINQPPDCSKARAVRSDRTIWPPNHKFRDIKIVRVTDPDGDAFTIQVDSIFQDEPTNGTGDGDTCPDAMGIGTDTPSVLAERSGGGEGGPGDGRYYWIYFTAIDDFGASCSGGVKVSVPHDKKTPAVNSGPLFDSTICP